MEKWRRARTSLPPTADAPWNRRDTRATHARVAYVRVMLTIRAYGRDPIFHVLLYVWGTPCRGFKRFNGPGPCHNAATCLNAIADRAVNRHTRFDNFTIRPCLYKACRPSELYCKGGGGGRSGRRKWKIGGSASEKRNRARSAR